jgi:hypothetical protein
MLNNTGGSFLVLLLVEALPGLPLGLPVVLIDPQKNATSSNKLCRFSSVENDFPLLDNR